MFVWLKFKYGPKLATSAQNTVDFSFVYGHSYVHICLLQSLHHEGTVQNMTVSIVLNSLICFIPKSDYILRYVQQLGFRISLMEPDQQQSVKIGVINY